MPLNLSEITGLLVRRGGAQYGREAVSQLDHALQCAHLAEQAGEPETLVAAALLHDIGHLLLADAPAAPEEPIDRDDLHQYLALPFMRGLFPEEVLEPIRLHVDAKRYLCQADARYHATLSPASQHSLQLQGGAFDANQAAVFLAQPHAAAAVRLRRYDDLAKTPGLAVPLLAHFEPTLARATR